MSTAADWSRYHFVRGARYRALCIPVLELTTFILSHLRFSLGKGLGQTLPWDLSRCLILDQLSESVQSSPREWHFRKSQHIHNSVIFQRKPLARMLLVCYRFSAASQKLHARGHFQKPDLWVSVEQICQAAVHRVLTNLHGERLRNKTDGYSLNAY